MRGKVIKIAIRRTIARITPAHAGKSGAVWALAVPAEGSPPRMRGEAARNHTRNQRPRITPAHAGRSSTGAKAPCTGRDHPRACGEKHTYRVYCPSNWGSPPRMRGEAIPHNDCGLGVGITPAHAGRSAAQTGLLHVAKDHPRACGEKLACTTWIAETMGSPPRMRGEDEVMAILSGLSGITPAHAGRSK